MYRSLFTLLFQEAEERRLEAVKEAIAGATQIALAEKMARRKALQSRSVPAICTDDDPSTAVEGRSTPAQQIERQQVESRQVLMTPGPQLHSRSLLVDAEVQTEQQQVLQIVCRCDDNNVRSRQSR